MPDATHSYRQSGLTFSISGGGTHQQIVDLQRDLRALGYLRSGIDGQFGSGTQAAVRALQRDLLKDAPSGSDGEAPVRVRQYRNDGVIAVDGVVTQDLVESIASMLSDPAYVKVPSSDNPVVDNQKVFDVLSQMSSAEVPIPFLLGILEQESSLMHYRVPQGANEDNFVTVGCDHNIKDDPDAISSRGYGVGQYTFFHHPLTPQEMAEFVLDPVKNVLHAIAELVEKFQHFVRSTDPNLRADDRIAEAGMVPLRLCKFSADAPEYMKDCRNCLRQAGTQTITAGVSRFFQGSDGIYEPTPEHRETNYTDVPIRANIPCDWSYATRRYNGSGVNSYHYQTEVLLRVLHGPRVG